MVGHPAQRSSAPLYRTLAASALIVAIIVAGGCADALDPVSPAAQPSELRQSASTSQSKLLQCPSGATRSITSRIGPLGGKLELEGTTVILPLGAVRAPTDFTLTIPASDYMEVRITAGENESYDFLHPASVTISYARCRRSNIDKRHLTVWHVDASTRELLENMGGTDDKTARTVTFGTGHLSGYSIGYGKEPPPGGEN